MKSTNNLLHANQLDENYLIFKTKDPAIYKQKQLNNQELYLFSEDITKKYAKRFFLNTYQNMYKYIKESKIKRIYENFEANDKIRLYIDVDINEQQIGKNNRDIFFKKIIDDIIKLLIDPLKKYNIIDPQIIILKSKNTLGKLSGHIIYPNVVFQNVEHLKYFFMDINSPLIKNKIIDPRAYKIGCLRMLFNEKFGKNNHLEYYDAIKYDYKDDLILFNDSSVKNFQNYEHKLIALKINKDETTGNIRLRKQLKLNNNIQTNNCIIPIEELQKFVNLLDIKRAIDYIEWINVGLAIYNSNPNAFEVWNQWSKNYSGYDLNTCIYKWNSFKPGRIGFGTIKFYARKDNPIEYNKLVSEIDKQLFQTIKINRRYLIEYEDQIEYSEVLDDNKLLINKLIDWWESKEIKSFGILSAYDTGKTTLIIKLIQKYCPHRVLWITHRQSLSNDIDGKFSSLGFFNYLDGHFTADKLICQIESVFRTLDDDPFDDKEIEIPTYDLIICDESESLLNHFDSPTILDQRGTFKLIQNILKNSKKILALDGDFGNRTYKYLESFGQSIIIENINKHSSKKLYFNDHKQHFDLNLDSDLLLGKNIILPCMSSKVAMDYYLKFKKQKYRVLLHTAKTDDYLKKQLKHVNELWIKYQIVIFSPSVESGVDMSKNHFDKMYCILCVQSTSPRGFLQMCSRVRKLKDDIVYIYTNGLKFRKKANFYTYNDVKQYMDEILFNSYKKKYYLDPIKQKYVYKIKKDLFDEIKVYNELENLNKNSYYLIPYLIKLAEEKGHEIHHIEEKFSISILPEERKELINEVKKLVSEEAKDKFIEYIDMNFIDDEKEFDVKNVKKDLLDIEDIDYDELEYLIYKQKRNEATSLDKLKIEKQMLKLHFGIDKLTIEFLDKFYGKTHVLYNLIGLIDDRNIKNYTIYEKFKRIDYDVAKKVEKNNMIREIINILGYDNIFDKKKIGKEQFIENTQKVLNESKFFKELKYSLPLFGMTKRPNISSNKSFLGFLNSLLVNWGISVKVIRQSKKNKGKVIKINWYEFLILDDIDEFINYKIMKGFEFNNKKRLILNKKTKWNNLIFGPNQHIYNKFLFI